MLRKANRRIAVGAALALVAASLVVLVPSAYAATITATPPSDTIATSATSTFMRQLVPAGNTTNPVAFTQSTGAPALVVSGTGLISTSGALSAAGSPYIATGGMTDTGSDSGTYTYTLNVTPGTITQIAPTAGSVSTAGSPTFSAQLNTTGGVGTLNFVKLGGSANLLVSTTGVVTVTGGPLSVGPYPLNGTVTDSLSNIGTFSFTLNVTAGAFTQVAPTSATVGTAGSASFTDQLNANGVGAVTYTETVGSSVIVSATGGVTTTGPLGSGTYSASGTMKDSLGNMGTFSFTLTVSTVPGAPSGVSASGGNNSASLHWSAPLSDGGSPITGYVITPFTVAPSPPSIGTPAVVGPGTSATVGGLTNGLHYAFTVAAMNINGTGPPSPLSSPVVPDSSGYWLVASDGGIFSFGSQQFFGSTGGMALNQPIVGMAATPSERGYWLVASDGGIFTFGDAGFFGSTGAKPLNKPIVGMAATPDGNGYWLVASDGGIFAFGDAKFHGSTGNKVLNKPVVGMATTSGGNGYWLVASDGGIFGFGTAAFYGSTGNIHLNKPIVGMSPTADGRGYWLVASDGGIFSFGDAAFHGSAGNIHLNRPIVGMDLSPRGNGYWLVASDGGIFSYGDAVFYGSTGGMALNRPIVGIG